MVLFASKFKSRFVAKGFWQRYGIDYTETFAPVAAIATIKLVLAVAAHFNMVCFQFDVEGAFLLPDIDHIVYVVDEHTWQLLPLPQDSARPQAISTHLKSRPRCAMRSSSTTA